MNKTSSRYSLPDVFDSLSTPSYYDSRLERQQMVENIMVGSAESGSVWCLALVFSNPVV